MDPKGDLLTPEIIVRPLAEIPITTLDKTTFPVIFSSAMLFNGELDLARFKTSLAAVANYCPWVFCTVSRNADFETCILSANESIPNSHDIPGYLRCEVADRSFEEFDGNIEVSKILPTVTQGKNIVCILRVSQFRNQFTLSYRVCHAFFDQSFIVYFFKCISQSYSYGCLNGLLPTFIPQNSVVSRDAVFGSLEEFTDATPAGIHTFTVCAYVMPCVF